MTRLQLDPDDVLLEPDDDTEDTEPFGEAAHPALEAHFALTMEIGRLYMLRDEAPDGLDDAVRACLEQISMADEVAFQMADLVDLMGRLPSHKGYHQLAIILEKRGDLDRAIRLCEQARAQGWTGDWTKRIERMEKRAAKSRVRIGG